MLPKFETQIWLSNALSNVSLLPHKVQLLSHLRNKFWYSNFESITLFMGDPCETHKIFKSRKSHECAIMQDD